MSSKTWYTGICLAAALLSGCSSEPAKKAEAETPSLPPARPIGKVVEIKAPLGLPPVPIPADNPPTAETIALGRRLYYDTILSMDRTISCATCHGPKNGFTDGLPVSTGIKGQKGGRSAPSVINAAYYTTQFWDGRAASLEEQAAGPVANAIEMGHTLAGVEERLNADPSYKADFEKAFGPRRITYDMVAKSIATFERTVLSGNSPFDRYMYGGDKKAMTPAQIRGLEIFRNAKKGNCAVCHTIEEKWATFSDSKFHNIGVGVSDGVPKDLGRFEITKVDADRGAFKTPTLRNITQTGPYMHDGSEKTLEDVRDFYIGAGNSNQWRDKEIKELDYLTGQERADLIAFLQALTGELPPDVGPPPAR
jgi:cytochrome c peroxidase